MKGNRNLERNDKKRRGNCRKEKKAGEDRNGRIFEDVWNGNRELKKIQGGLRKVNKMK